VPCRDNEPAFLRHIACPDVEKSPFTRKTARTWRRTRALRNDDPVGV
jgi:hypothetical protein